MLSFYAGGSVLEYMVVPVSCLYNIFIIPYIKIASLYMSRALFKGAWSWLLFSCGVVGVTVIKANCIKLIANAYFTRVKARIFYISMGTRGVAGLGRNVVPVCRPNLRRVIRHGRRTNHLRFAASLARYLGRIRILFDTMNAPPSRSNDTSLGCILRMTHAINHGVAGRLLIIAGDAIPMNATHGIHRAVRRRLSGQNLPLRFSITSGPRFLGRNTTVGSFVDPSHIIINIRSRHTGRLVAHLCHPFLLGGFHIVFVSMPSTRVAGCTTGTVLTAHVDFVGSITGLYRVINTSIGVIHGKVNSSTHVNGHFLCTNVNCKNSYFPGSVGTLVGATGSGNCQVHVLRTIRTIGRRRGSVLFHGLSSCFGNSLGNGHVTV